jgi:hypothetical protein
MSAMNDAHNTAINHFLFLMLTDSRQCLSHQIAQRIFMNLVREKPWSPVR